MAKGIYKRGNVYWVRFAGLDGRVLRESSGSDKFRDAEALLIKRRNEVKEGKQPEVKRIAHYLFSELAKEYLKWSEKQRSFGSKKVFIAQLNEAFRHMPLRRFSTRLVEQLCQGKFKSVPKRVNEKCTTHPSDLVSFCSTGSFPFSR